MNTDTLNFFQEYVIELLNPPFHLKHEIKTKKEFIRIFVAGQNLVEFDRQFLYYNLAELIKRDSEAQNPAYCNTYYHYAKEFLELIILYREKHGTPAPF